MRNAVGDRWSTAVVAVSVVLSTAFSRFLSLLLYDFFLILTSSALPPWGYCTCLIMMKHVSFSPNLYTTAWHVLGNDLRDLRARRTGKLAFPSLGWRCWGWVYNNQYQNDFQTAEACGYCTCLIMLQHVPFSPNLYSLDHCMTRFTYWSYSRFSPYPWPKRQKSYSELWIQNV
jgi:hypothetical protein